MGETTGTTHQIALAVDDDPSMRLMLRKTLERTGLEVHEAGNGQLALDRFQELHPDIVLLDISMPVMDGFRACTEMRRLENDRQTPIVMVTGADDHDSIRRAYEVGATDFITKPINWRILSHRVRYMLRASQTMRQLRESEMRNRAILEAMPDIMFRIAADGTILDFRPGQASALDLKTSRPVGRTVSEVLSGTTGTLMENHLRRALRANGIQQYDFEVKSALEERVYESRLVASGRDEVFAIVRDVTDTKRAEERMRQLAYFDEMTGLPNRQFFKEQLEQSIAQARRYKRQMALLFVDLDRFKRINDTLGHNIGDLLLKRVAHQISHSVRESDVVGRAGVEELGQIARLGGDEFTVVLSEIKSPEEAAQVARRIQESLVQPMKVGGYEIVITPSIGVAIYPDHGEDLNTLLKNADVAMYYAKGEGRNNYQFYTPAMNERAFDRLTLENALRRALDNNELFIHYQPQVNLESGEMVGVEALARWQHPERGLLSAGNFIPLAEETGQVILIGEWVLRRACEQHCEWLQAGLPPLRMAVNLSGLQFRQEGLLFLLRDVIEKTGIDPAYLELEVTESILMQNTEQARERVQELKDLGVTLAVDDFGTGYSSLSYLKNFPVKTLKIDQSFIRNVAEDADSMAITDAIIAMAHSLGMRVIAEGVEKDEQLNYLRRQNCDEVQGFLFSRPVAPEVIDEHLRRQAEGVLLPDQPLLAAAE
ncbi:putative bifunctional diguanylate cyclase/phosphodiesterase [Thioalbus denitrificans]|uniref:cyclic-guanylate-specific phosphodiesterase n=1 Tax=Thioalbus denitrificans TaxID=547122 RepID=A0A369BWR1_9GAMM|nr:EAL domain-containing protein [Thioalbus denitrificans]RCX24857.1 response regulator receiver modulated diguanylate cyclase/phosphodiesterase [Thioalbus denitrificans]